MKDARYSASKSRTQGRSAWTLTFRHPLCHDDEGRPGVKVRRGLGTSDESTADALVKEMNTLLGDETYWDIYRAASCRATLQQRGGAGILRTHGEPCCR